jgi:peptide/nickel transport system permease protein
MSATAGALELVRTRRWVPNVRGSLGVRVSVLVIAVIALVTAAAPLIAPYNPSAVDLTNTVAGTSTAHWLGTDQLGRDVLSRLIFGGRTSLLGPLIVVLGSSAIAVPVSLVASYRRGVLDAVLSRVWDAMFGFPTLLLAIAIVATFGPGFWTATLAVTAIYVPLLARVVRGSVLLEREKPYIEAARIQGFSQRRIVFAHILPNVAPVIGAQAVLNFGYSLLDLAGLAFLGFGVQPPTPDWGEMLIDGQSSLVQHAYLEVLSVSAMITITVLAFNALGYHMAQRAGRRG